MPMKRGLISVVIPAFNAEKYLAPALDSVLAQESVEQEILVVDDGSSDATGAIARSYKQVRYFFQENQGSAVARNTGIQNARGEFIAFLDSDDLWLPRKNRTQLDLLQSRPELGCAIAKQRNFIAEGIERPFWLSDSMLDGRFLYSLGTVMVRRPVFDVVGFFDSYYRLSQDLDWFVRLSDAGVPVGWMFDELAMLRRAHSTNISYNRPSTIRYQLRIMKASIDRKRARCAVETAHA